MPGGTGSDRGWYRRVPVGEGVITAGVALAGAVAFARLTGRVVLAAVVGIAALLISFAVADRDHRHDDDLGHDRGDG